MMSSNSFKRKSFGDNSVNLAEINQKIKNSTDKINTHSFVSPTNNDFLKQNYLEDPPKEENIKKYNKIYNNNLNKNEISYEDYNDNKKDNSFNFYNDSNDNNKIDINNYNIVNKKEIIKSKEEPINFKNNNINNNNT